MAALWPLERSVTYRVHGGLGKINFQLRTSLPYLTALAPFRERVPESEWMAHVWSKDTVLESDRKAELESALVRHYNAIARKLEVEPGNYGPMLQEDPSTGEVIWDDWILGFEYAARLRRGAWARIEGCKEPDVVEAVRMLDTLYQVASAEGAVEEFARIEPMVPALICAIVGMLNKRERNASEA